MSIFVLNLATLLGFGLGVDYALLLASRFREEMTARGGGRTADGAVDQAVGARRKLDAGSPSSTADISAAISSSPEIPSRRGCPLS